nr:transposase [Cellvibrionaceae bacterium]
DHRKQWIVSRLKFLSYVYSIDICAYAVMSNHYHVVLHVDKARAEAWTREEVVERWLQLYKGSVLVDRWLQNPKAMDKASLEVVYALIEVWRERLYDISWFMRGVNETIARMANQEENCKGRFWEGRYKSQALLDETALLSCMAYVDLNPIRAGIEKDPESSDFTSIQQRLFDYVKYKSKKTKSEKQVVVKVQQQRQLKTELALDNLPEQGLMPFSGSSHTDIHDALPFTREDYFVLVDKTGRAIRDDKRGVIRSDMPSILQQFGIDPDQWLEQVKHFNRRYASCVGRVTNMQNFAEKRGRRWPKGIRAARDCEGSAFAATAV